MPPCERFLGTKGGRDAEDIADGGKAGFEVELRGLREVDFFAVIGELEERGAAFDLRLHHAGQGFEAAGRYFRFVGFAEGTKEGGADFHYRGRVVATKDEVAVVVEGLGF